jgi:flagellin FlaB
MLTSDVRGADVGSETEKTTMFENTNDDERRGQVGIGTLIVFIAMVLVAAIAAGVLVNTAGFLQNTAEQSGEDSVEKVTNRVDVVNTYGIIGADDDVEYLNLTVRLAAGSENVDLNDTTINYLSDSSVVTLENASSMSGTEFTIAEVKDDDSSNPILNDEGDRLEIQINASAIEGSSGLDPGSEVKLEISTKSGDSTTVLIQTPDTYSGKSDGEPIAL